MTDTRSNATDHGFTLIEALVVLAIAAVAFAMAPIAINLGKLSLGVAADLERRANAHQALASLSNRIAAARPIFEPTASGLASLTFEGFSDRVRFVAEFTDGPFGGGLYKVDLGIDQSTSHVVVSLAPYVAGRGNSQTSILSQLLPSDRLALRYYGRFRQTDSRAWRPDWVNANRLPDMVEISVGLSADGASRPATVIALRLAK